MPIAKSQKNNNSENGSSNVYRIMGIFYMEMNSCICIVRFATFSR